MKPRRSWMVVPAHDAAAVQRAREAQPDARADVIVLDLEYSVPPRAKEAARAGLAQTVAALADAGAEVFVRIDRDTRWADVRAAVSRGITGIVYPGPDTAAEVAELAACIGAAERERGVDPDSTELVLVLESAQGFWNVAELATASPRVTAIGVGRIDLTMRLGPVPQGEFRLQRYLLTRALVAARTFGKQPLGAFWRPGSRGGVATREATAQASREGRMLGYTGCFCATPEQVAPVNQGYAAA